jgi:hypothetical protein
MRQVPLLTRLFVPLLLIALLASPVPATDNVLTPQEKAEGWQLLFNGKDHTGWKCNNGKPIATPIEDGCLLPFQSGGYVIIYDKPFGDFVLKCDLKWEADRCNSGVFFRVEDPRNPVHTGFEIQVASGTGVGKHAFGAIYDLAPTTTNASRGTGQWNTLEIRCQGPEISVKLNGQEVSRLNCDDYDQPGVCPDGKKHKFKLQGQPRAVKDFARTGYLGFQDHGQKVWYKNVKLRELK